MRARSTAWFARTRAAGACPFLSLPCMFATMPAFAQQSGKAEAPPSGNETAQSKLQSLQKAIEASEGKRKALAGDIETYRTDRAKFRSQLLDLVQQLARQVVEVRQRRRVRTQSIPCGPQRLLFCLQ